MKVCILAAGIGSRMKQFSQSIHKALLPLGNRAILSRIIDQFEPDSQFVIAVGHLGHQIRDYLSLAHPQLDSVFVEVSPYEGQGAGPGLSLYSCKEYLQQPFIFTACDTLITGDIPGTSSNWMGIQQVESVKHWCSVTMSSDSRVTGIFYKEEVDTPWAFVGIAGIRDYQLFWKAFAGNKELLGGELQVNNGLIGLLEAGLRGEELEWRDTGSEASYERLLELYEKNYTFPGKTNELTYRAGEWVIKFFEDEARAQTSYQRAREYQGVFPEVFSQKGGFYSYAFEEGRLLSSLLSYPEVSSFLEWAEENLWKTLEFEQGELARLRREFYIDKTRSRLNRYLETFQPKGEPVGVSINSLPCSTATSLLDGLGREFLQGGIASTYHGDLHDDNIVKTAQGYKLIDWRSSFGSSVRVGDRYYDLAKFLHTLHLSVKTMEQGAYRFLEEGDRVTIEHQTTDAQIDGQRAFQEFVFKYAYDMRQIEIINALVFLNMAPLYAERMAHYLYYLGRYLLQKAINGDDTES